VRLCAKDNSETKRMQKRVVERASPHSGREHPASKTSHQRLHQEMVLGKLQCAAKKQCGETIRASINSQLQIKAPFSLAGLMSEKPRQTKKIVRSHTRHSLRNNRDGVNQFIQKSRSIVTFTNNCRRKTFDTIFLLHLLINQLIKN
jgi:hypothetical protein